MREKAKVQITGGNVMIDYMKRHERYIKEMLGKNLNVEALRDLLEYHDEQIQWM